MRLVSLVPSLTHMLCDLGLRSQLVGCTTFCIEPKGLSRQATLVGGTKDASLERIAQLQPTHIIANSEENTAALIRGCEQIAPTWVSLTKTPHEVPELLREAGRWFNAEAAAEEQAASLEEALGELRDTVQRATQAGKLVPRSYLYYIWREPYMVAGPDTYISAMLECLGYRNKAPLTPRYSELTLAAAAELGPELILLSTEPYPFRRRDKQRLLSDWPRVSEQAPPLEVIGVNGQLLSWYGTMTKTAVVALKAAAKGDQEGTAAKLFNRRL